MFVVELDVDIGWEGVDGVVCERKIDDVWCVGIGFGEVVYL